MFDTYKMQEHICRELEKKAEAGLKSTADLDTIWKLIDSYKNLLKIDMLQEAGEYSHDSGDYSERRHRDSRGRYASDGSMRHAYEGGSSHRDGTHDGYTEAKERYMEDKHSYRSSHSPESKRNMELSMRECMDKLKVELQGMMSAADTREEREKLRDMIREIGNIA